MNEDTKEKSLKKAIKNDTKEWCEDWTAHGFPNIVKTNRWAVRSFWLIVLTIFLAFLIYCINFIFINQIFLFEFEIKFQLITIKIV